MTFDILRFLIAVLLLNAPIALARDPEIIVSTHTYKKVGNLKINLDAHRPEDKKIRPLAVWIHGGALINGGRNGVGHADQAERGRAR